MAHYVPPLRDMQFVLQEVLDVEGTLQQLPVHADLNLDLINQVLGAGGKFCSEVLHPLNASGDLEGCSYDPKTGAVRTPAGFKEAYARFVEAGWPSLNCDPAHGGQGLPQIVKTGFQEMTTACNQAWSMYPGLTHGVSEILRAHGTGEQKTLYLPKLVGGEWAGTMCLTEPHCGTDLGLLRTRAEPASDGTYRLTGSKIFITSGEHDFTPNIIHMVLARLPGAPEGTRGISLFLVPKFLPDADGQPGVRNGVRCNGIENKMGIHASPTCQMAFDGATGWLVGQPHQGLKAMFVLMNVARLGVGTMSLGLMEAAYQASVAYARERLQMRALSGPKAPELAADPIIVHADVRRMLLTQRAYLEGSRALAYWAALLTDVSERHADPVQRKQADDVLTLLTPVVKAFISDAACECTNLAVQVHGGHGYIVESGVEQLVRDARINPIYEGTNGIQSLDLLGRKVLADGGARMKIFGTLVHQFAQAHKDSEPMREFLAPLEATGTLVMECSLQVGARAFENRDEVGAAAVDYLRLFSHYVYAYLWARMAQVSLGRADDPFYAAKLVTARFYVQRLLPETRMLAARIQAGGKNLFEMDAEQF